MKAQVYLAFAAALCWLAARTDAFAGTLPGAAVCARRGAASTAMAGQPSTAPPLSRRSACAVILCGAVAWRLGGAAPAVAASTAPEELAKLEHDALIQLAPEVQGEQRLAAWRKEKEEIKEALAREAAGQRPLPRVVEGADKAFKPPVVTAKSSAEALEIGAHLKEIGAVMVCAAQRQCIVCARMRPPVCVLLFPEPPALVSWLSLCASSIAAVRRLRLHALL